MLATVSRLADCNEAKLSNFNQCCFSAAEDRASGLPHASEWSQAFAKVCGIICPSRIVQEYPMAPRANWKGYLRLSLVSCPIALYPASSLSEKVSFNRINRKTGNDDPSIVEPIQVSMNAV
jgi:hypothetical protein